MRWIYEEEDKIESSGSPSLQHAILDMGGEVAAETLAILCDR